MHGHGGDFTLEREWNYRTSWAPSSSVEIVHTDPDGGG
jgi:hypothetical protein